MVSSTKFFIYGGGTWREVNLNTGHVEGWGQARFAYSKRGKVKMAKSRAVLAALRNLKEGKTSAVKDGENVPCKKIAPPQRSEDKYTDTRSSHCYQHSKYNGCLPSKTAPTPIQVHASPIKQNQRIDKADAGIQTNLPSQTLIYPGNYKLSLVKPRIDSKIAVETPTNIITTATVQLSPKKINSPIKNMNPELKTKSSIENSENVSSKKKLPTFKLNKMNSSKYNLYQRKRSDSSDSIVWVVLPKSMSGNEESTKNLIECVETKTKKKKRRISTTSSSSASQRPKTKRRIISSTDFTVRDKNDNRNIVDKSHCTSDENDIELSKSNVTKMANVSKVKNPARQDKFKELIIDESDVELLRNYLIKKATDFDLLKFDQDDEYKKEFFYTINPLVNVERCTKIARMLKGDNEEDISLKEFASQLGLQSVLEKSATQRYKMRKTKERISYNKELAKSNSMTEKRVKEKQNAAASKSRNRNSTDSNTESESIELDLTRNSRRVAANTSKTRETRRSASAGKQSCKNDTVEAFLTKNANVIISGQDSDESNSSVAETHARVLRKRKSNNISIDKTESEAYQRSLKPNGRGQNSKQKASNTDMTSSSDESDQAKESSKDNRDRVQRRSSRKIDPIEKSNANEDSNKNINKAENTNERNQINDDDKENREQKDKNTKVVSKIPKYVNNQNINNSRNDVKLPKPIQTSHSKKNNREHKKTSESEETSDDEKSSNNSKIKQQNKLNDRNNNSTDTNDDDSEQEYRNKENKRQLKVNNKIDSKARKEYTRELEIHRGPTKNKNKINDTTETVYLTSASESDEFSKKTVISQMKSVAAKKVQPSSSSSSLRMEYSNMEDHAIVAWISIGGRARCVNGNRIWRELQEQFYSIAGQHRTWHSLRNRYLRNILPRLGSLALNPSLATRLRAAAATGEIKSRNIATVRRNSIFRQPIAGALSRRRARLSTSESDEHQLPPKRHKHDNSRKSPILTSKLLRSAEKPARSPRYSEITRRFATTHNSDSTPASSPTIRTTPERQSPRKKSLVTANSATEATKNSPATRLERKLTEKSPATSKETRQSSRKSLRDKSPVSNEEEPFRKRLRSKSLVHLSPATKNESKSSDKERTRTRKLYNPSAQI